MNDDREAEVSVALASDGRQGGVSGLVAAEPAAGTVGAVQDPHGVVGALALRIHTQMKLSEIEPYPACV